MTSIKNLCAKENDLEQVKFERDFYKQKYLKLVNALYDQLDYHHGIIERSRMIKNYDQTRAFCAYEAAIALQDAMLKGGVSTTRPEGKKNA